MTYRIRNIGIAVALAIVAALLTTFYVTNYKRTVQQGESEGDRLCRFAATSRSERPAPTSSQRKMFARGARAARSVVPGAISKPDQIDNWSPSSRSTRASRSRPGASGPLKSRGSAPSSRATCAPSRLPETSISSWRHAQGHGDRVDVVGTWLMPEAEPEPRQPCRPPRPPRPAGVRDDTKIESKIGSDPNAPFSRMLALTDAQAQKSVRLVEERRVDASAPPRHRRDRQPGGVETSSTSLLRRPRRRSSADAHDEEAGNDRRDPGTAPPARRPASSSRVTARASPSWRTPSGATARSSSSGKSDHVREGAGPLTGGHLQAVLHATRSSALPVDELAAIREYTQAPIVLLASGESSALLEEALDADVADVLLLPQLTENVVFAIRKAEPHRPPRQPGRSSRAATAASSPSSRRRAERARPSWRRTSPRRSPSTAASKTLLLDLDLQFGDAAIMLGIEPDKTIQDLVTAPGELDPEKLAGYITPALVRARRPPRADPARGRRARHRGEAGPADGGREGVVRPDRRRHLAVLPRPDAGHPRPDRRPAAPLRARRADDQERPAEPADAPAPLVPARADPRRARTARTRTWA